MNSVAGALRIGVNKVKANIASYLKQMNVTKSYNTDCVKIRNGLDIKFDKKGKKRLPVHVKTTSYAHKHSSHLK